MTSGRRTLTEQDIFLTPENRAILGKIPERWGRMNPSSQAALLEIGRLLQGSDLLDDNRKVADHKQAGLIVATRRGSLDTDLAYGETVAMGPEFTSPALFGYTLSNIPLAEAAIHYNLTGPVFSLFSDTPKATALSICREWLDDPANRSEFIIAGSLDATTNNQETTVSASFTICHA